MTYTEACILAETLRKMCKRGVHVFVVAHSNPGQRNQGEAYSVEVITPHQQDVVRIFNASTLISVPRT